MKAGDQALHLGGRPLDPLKEDAAAENQHARDVTGDIAALRQLDDAVDLGVVDAFGGTAAIDESLKNGPGIARVRVAWKTEFVEHGSARLVCAGQAALSSE